MCMCTFECESYMLNVILVNVCGGGDCMREGEGICV